MDKVTGIAKWQVSVFQGWSSICVAAAATLRTVSFRLRLYLPPSFELGWPELGQAAVECCA